MAGKKLKVGFIGLGLMGGPMAKNIFKKGYPLSVYNRSSDKTKEFKKIGATVYNSPADLGANVDVVITCVTAPKDVREVLLGKQGVAQKAAKGTIVIDMSTIGPKAAREIGEDLAFVGIEFLDAPVTGGTVRAESGELTIFVGGEKRIFEKVREVLEAMGTDIQYMGQVGLGQAIKLVNNLIVGETIATLAEGFLLGEAMGLSRKKIVDSLQNVFGLSPNMRGKMPAMVANKFPVTFSVSNIRKDLKLALEELKKGSPLPLLKISEKLYKKGMDNGFGNEDLAAVIKVLEHSKQ